MATAGAIRAGRAFVELFADDSKLVKGLGAAAGRLKHFGTVIAEIGGGIMAAGLGILAPLGFAVNKATEMGTELVRAAARIGDTVENVGALGTIAEEAGLDMESLTRAIFKFQAQGGKGVEDFAAKIDELAHSTEGAAEAADLFGARAGAKMLQLARLTEGGMTGLIAELKEMGLVMSGPDAQSAEKFNAELLRMELIGKLATQQIGSALIPVLREIVEPLTKAAMQALQWVKANRELVVTIAAVGVVLVIAGAAVVAFGAAIAGVGFVISGVTAILNAITSPLALFVAGVLLVASPFIAATVAALYFTGTLEGLVPILQSLLERFKETWGGILDALKAGNLALAAKIAWTAVKVEILEILATIALNFRNWINDLKMMWNDFVGPLIGGAAGKLFGGASVLLPRRLPGMFDVQRDASEGDKARFAEVLRLRGELARMIAEAHEGAKKKPKEKPPGTEGGPAGFADTVKGLFSSSALKQSLAISDKISERIADSTERTADGVEGILDAIGKNGLVFG